MRACQPSYRGVGVVLALSLEELIQEEQHFCTQHSQEKEGAWHCGVCHPGLVEHFGEGVWPHWEGVGPYQEKTLLC